MDEEEKSAKDDLTEEETEEMKETGATPEDAHREGEFDDLRDKLDKVLSAIDSMNSTLSVLVKSGAVTVDESGSNSAVKEDDALEEIPGVDDLDLSI